MLRIRTLIENSPGLDGTAVEHGLSFLVERDGRAVLFDTGKSGAFVDNAKVLNVDLGSIQALAISHGHYDHAGGVRSFLERTRFHGPVWTGAGFFDKKWSIDPEGPRYAGTDFSQEYLASCGCSWNSVSALPGRTVTCEIVPGIFAVNGFPRVRLIEEPNSRFMVDRGGARLNDGFSDEICLAASVDGGIAVVLGCAHPGIMNMLDAVQSVFGEPIVAVFGGSHLVEAAPERISETIDYLTKTGCVLAALGHCTGERGIAALSSDLPAYRPLSVGTEFII
jgi:7,8-dihydropterin-6-yl-methyl-4-(beta-D-ribofuranosyl)aminobenzene 5'-phosphate synthase